MALQGKLLQIILNTLSSFGDCPTWAAPDPLLSVEWVAALVLGTRIAVTDNHSCDPTLATVSGFASSQFVRLKRINRANAG